MVKMLYFAYGSNLSKERIEDRLNWLGKVKRVRSYRLYGYELCFNASSRMGFHSFLNIRPSKSRREYVDGLLYEINTQQFRTLDNFEALYERQYFIISQNEVGCTYVCVDEANLSENAKLEEYYYKLVLRAAKLNGLTHTVEALEKYSERIGNFAKKGISEKYYEKEGDDIMEFADHSGAKHSYKWNGKELVLIS